MLPSSLDLLLENGIFRYIQCTNDEPMEIYLNGLWSCLVCGGCCRNPFIYVSVLIRSTAAGMGIMLAALVSGSILSAMVSSWESAKYLFMVNLNLTGYLNGMAPPIEGMTLLFSIGVLARLVAYCDYDIFLCFYKAGCLLKSVLFKIQIKRAKHYFQVFGSFLIHPLSLL